MTIKEFSDQFDVLYNNITSNQAPGLNEYEKSVFLTKAQDEIVKNYFSPNSKGNNLQQGFDDSEKRQIDFSMLMRTVKGTTVTASVNIHSGSNTGYYAMPTDILLYINEVLHVLRGGNNCQLTVVPVSFTEYNRLMSKPFKRPLKNQAWRLITSGAASSYIYTDYAGIASIIASISGVTATSSAIFTTINGKELAVDSNKLKVEDRYLKADGTLTSTATEALDISSKSADITANINKTVPASSTVVEIIPGPNDTISDYIVRYVARPTPIILEDLEYEDVTLGGGLTQATNCMLDPILHEEILQRAVELAKIAWAGNQEELASAQLNMTSGQRSE